MKMPFDICFYVLVALISINSAEDDGEEDLRKREPSLCEVCKFLVTELKDRLYETGKSKEVLHMGQGLESTKKIKYPTSELRLIEALNEPHVCERILDYNIHAEFKGTNRYKKGMSETMETLHGLVNKGVKVELGMPYELWDKPSAEVTLMQRKCFNVVERFEDDIEEWYYHKQHEDLMDYLCRDRVLDKDDQACLDEKLQTKKDLKGEKTEEKSEKKSKKLKGDPGTKGKKSMKKDKSEKTPKQEL